MILYKTAYKRAEASIEIKRSKFIAHGTPVDTIEQARAFIEEIKEMHKDATHNVPAFIVGNKMEHMWASDDGEPQGTSGPPILKLLENEGITNIALVVTRYFGGTKLGTGGLVRAYTDAVKAYLDVAGLAFGMDMRRLRLKLDYDKYSILEKNITNFRGRIDKVEYDQRVHVDVVIPVEDEEGFEGYLSNLALGRRVIEEKKDIISLIKSDK